MASAVIDVRAVLGDLATHHRLHGEDSAGTAVMTLVAFFESPEVGIWLRNRLHSLASKDPARVILLDASADAGAYRVGEPCAEHDDCVKSRGEWIELSARDGSPAELQSLVRGLVLPQAPVALVWAADARRDDPRFTGLAAEARVVVYNSSALDNGDRGLRALIEFAAGNPSPALCDLAYLRLAPWQDSIALCFDAKSAIHELFDLRRVEIHSGSAAEAYYLLGWLASRLEWSGHGESRFRNRFGTDIEFSISLVGTPRRIGRVALHSSRSHFVAEVARESADLIEVRVTGSAQAPNRYRPINNIDTASLIEWAVLGSGEDRVFADSLAAAAAVLARVRAE